MNLLYLIPASFAAGLLFSKLCQLACPNTTDESLYTGNPDSMEEAGRIARMSPKTLDEYMDVRYPENEEGPAGNAGGPLEGGD